MAAMSEDEKDFLELSKMGKGSDQHCCVPNCKSNGRRHQVSFHRFPQAGASRNSWIQAIRRDPGPLFNSEEQEEDIQESEEHLRNPSVVAENIEKELERKLKERDDEIKQLKEKLRIARFGVCRFSNDDAMIMFSTGFSTYALFLAFFTYVQPAANSVTSYYYKAIDTINLSVSRQRTMSEEQEEDIQESEEHLRNPSVVAENIEKELERKLKERDDEIKQLKEKLRIARFGVCRFSNDDAMIMFYTGFSTYALFLAFFTYVQPAANSVTSYYYKAIDTINLSVSRQRTMVLIDELFMFLCRFKYGLFEQDLACRFNVHVSTVSRKLITWSIIFVFCTG
ncbi:unnamed protein product [Mytilus coruscus]|uniref:THAP-type domain-containing protein n=1 Tax=Mytilus coruscus TaxID=42192 RepID=A0A6J8A136_MYTCO|nr:unnamed protein product [Mytilus coruscus]